MWRIVIASQSGAVEEEETVTYAPDSNIVQDSDHSSPSSRSSSPTRARKSRHALHDGPQITNRHDDQQQAHLASPLKITTTKVCMQRLPLPDGVEVIHASPAAGHLSSSSIYPACFAPYLICTACSDNSVRFWRCKIRTSSTANSIDSPYDGIDVTSGNPSVQYDWSEWEMITHSGASSAIDVPGKPLNVSCAYSGRISCAYKTGASFTRPATGDTTTRYVNLSVAIYECESTGGSEWILEDTIQLKNVGLPQIRQGYGLDLRYIYDKSILEKKKQSFNSLVRTLSHEDVVESDHVDSALQGLVAVPSFSTLQTLRKAICEQGNQCPLTQKHLVQLDWVSTEDGSHVLTVGIGSKVLLFTAVGSDVAQANLKAMQESRSSNRPMLKKASSMVVPLYNTEEVRWMKVGSFSLETADGLPPLPMQLSWVRDGILVIGMDNEMHVYSQWQGTVNQPLALLNTSSISLPSSTDVKDGSPSSDSIQLRRSTSRVRRPTTEFEESFEHRTLTDQDLRQLAHEAAAHHRLAPHLTPAAGSKSSMLSLASSANLVGGMDPKKKRELIGKGLATGETAAQTDIMPDYGLFEASRIACPVLPQYHPKQLMELLNFGKIRRVKAILAHLVRCLAGSAAMLEGTESKSRHGSSTGSASGSPHMRSWSRSRAMSISVPAMQAQHQSSPGLDTSAMVPEELTLDYTEISAIPPLPLFTLLAADREASAPVGRNASANSQGYSDLFDNVYVENEEDLDEILEDFSTSPRLQERQKQQSSEKNSLSYFSTRQTRLLTSLLTHTHLPGLSSLDQMHLLALADTVATFNTEFSDKFTIDASKAQHQEHGPKDGTDIDSLDDCGLRFLLAMRHRTYLLRFLPPMQRAQLQRSGLSASNIVWAFHSESEEELLNIIPSVQRGTPKWDDLRELGFGWWIRSNAVLRRAIEKVAKAAFQHKNNPLDAALFYLAMRKKNVVWGLFRSVHDDRMTQFFANNFEQDRWRKAALKNAFALLGKQRFEHATAFFLLGGALKDAIEVCLNKLDDIQLAMVIIRLYEGQDIDPTPPSVLKLLYQYILGREPDGTGYDPAMAHPDPFMRSMAYWLVKDCREALSTLLETNIGTEHPRACEDEGKAVLSFGTAANPSVFNFYLYLRTHPLLIRRQIADLARGARSKVVLLSGFNYGLEPVSSEEHQQVFVEDAITPLERRLYFTTAHAHFKAGCPALALEVLSKLPNKVLEGDDGEGIYSSLASPAKPLDSTPKHSNDNDVIATGIIGNSSATEFDWSQPTVNVSKYEEDNLDLTWEEDKEDEEEGEEEEKAVPKREGHLTTGGPKLSVSASSGGESAKNSKTRLDIMAQQLKFIACLKIMMEELSTLATGFEVDGGQLRYQLYIWLEQEVDALKEICNCGDSGNEEKPGAPVTTRQSSTGEHDRPHTPTTTFRPGEKPTLHEILVADKLDFEAKLLRAEKRRHWLKANQTLLRTLLSYCSLHGASGGGLSSVRMELILLLQELHQEKSQRQLLSPLPFPTTLPLLSASVACHKTVVTDPIRHLQSMTHDILSTVVDFSGPPSPSRMDYGQVFVLRDLAIALSACIYQSLCDSESFSVKHSGYLSAGMEALASASVVYYDSHLMAGQGKRRRYSSSEDPLEPITSPCKWPGVQSLRALLAREKDEDAPKLTTLLCETFVAVYLSLLVHGLATCEALILYRLVGQKFSDKTWALLFGGGAKRLLKVAVSSDRIRLPSTGSIDFSSGGESVSPGSSPGLLTTLSKQRMKLHMKILGPQSGNVQPQTIKEDRPTYREQFVPPQMSMVSCLMSKPHLPDNYGSVDYDSSESVPSEGEEEEEVLTDDELQIQQEQQKLEEPCTEHSDPNSYSWCILRYAIIRLAQHHLQAFLNISGMELQDLPVASPLIHSILRVIDHWLNDLKDELDSRGGVPDDYIPGCYVDKNITAGPAMNKYRAILEPGNTPFKSRSPAIYPVRRLWLYLVHQECVQDIFIRYIFGRRRHHIPAPVISVEDLGGDDAPETHLPDPIRIIHKDQDSISAFCINKPSPGIMALATSKEIQELNIQVLLEPPSWLEDECEFDILNLSNEVPAPVEYLVVQTAADRPMLAQMVPSPSFLSSMSGSQMSSPTSSMPSFPSQSSQRSTAPVLMKHRVDGVRRMSAHPILPIYLSGGQDGSVRLWEWGHQQPLAIARQPGTYAKVTRVQFNPQGNKFGVSDSDGNLSLWQLGLNSSGNKAFMTLQCHTKQVSDFVFVGSSSLLATAGLSAESKNVCLWDTLLPQKKSLVQAFTCHEQGASCIAYAPQHQLLISGGKKGLVCIFDLRQRMLRHKFQAHEGSAIKCLALDPGEEFFVTGSADGDIKVWGLTLHNVFFNFHGEHTRNTFFRNIGMGVTQLYVDMNGRLFSCGADGSMKLRQLPEREMVVNTYY